jgi:hypothetical protein
MCDRVTTRQSNAILASGSESGGTMTICIRSDHFNKPVEWTASRFSDQLRPRNLGHHTVRLAGWLTGTFFNNITVLQMSRPAHLLG